MTCIMLDTMTGRGYSDTVADRVQPLPGDTGGPVSRVADPADPARLYRVAVEGVPGRVLAELEQTVAPLMRVDPDFAGQPLNRNNLVLLAALEGVKALRARYGLPDPPRR